MKRNLIIKVLAFTMLFNIIALAQNSDDIVGLWYSHADAKNRIAVIEIFKENNKYYAYSFAYTNSNDVVYDVNNPKKGKVYNAKIDLSSNKQEIKLKASVDGAGLFGKTLTWRKVPANEVSKYTPLNKNELRRLN